MSTFIFSNNVSTTLAAGISSSATSVTLASSANLPVISAGEVFTITFNDAATQTQFEIVYCTARTGAVCTIIRGQEGTTAQAWATGDFAFGAVTAAELEGFVQAGGSGFVELSPPVAQTGNISIDGEIDATGNINALGDISANGTIHGTAVTGDGAGLTSVIHAIGNGAGIGTSGGSSPTLSNTGVLSVQAQTGDVLFTSSDGTLLVTASGGTINFKVTPAGTIFRKQVRPSASSVTTLTLPALPGSGSVVYDLYASGSGDTVPGGYQQLAGSGGTWESGYIVVPDSGAVGPEPIDYMGTATGGQTPTVTYTFSGSVGSTGYIGVFSLQATARPA